MLSSFGELLGFLLSPMHAAVALVLVAFALLYWFAEQMGPAPSVSPQGLVRLMNDKAADVVDVRDRKSFLEGHIASAVHYALEPEADFFAVMKSYEARGRVVVLVCARGLTAGSVASKLIRHGMSRLFILKGGMEGWKDAHMPVSTR